MDFIHDRLANDRRIRCLSIVDDFTRESIALEVDTSLSELRVARFLDEIWKKRSFPKMIRVDNGQEFTRVAMDIWHRKTM